MAVAQDNGSIAPKVTARRRISLEVLLATAAAYALTLLVFYPGYRTIDAGYVYAHAQAWRFGDWQSPAMAVLWRLIDPLAPGALSMFLLIATLYWLGFGMLALMAARRSLWLGLATVFLALTPPAFFFVGMIWRDVLFAVVWLVAAVLAFVVADRAARLRPPMQALALFLIAFGVLLRPNALVAAPLMAAYALWPMRFELKRVALVFVPALALCYALVPLVYYGLLDAERQNPLHSIMVFDLGGITHFAGENQFPVAWSEEQTALLTSKCYDPVRWDSYWHVEPCPFVMRRLERPDDTLFGTPRLTAAWRQAISAHPLVYLGHRTTFMWQFLARSNLVLPVWDWLDPASSYGHRPYFTPLVALHDRLQPTVLFRPGFWLVLALAVAAWAFPARATAAGAFAVAVTTSAVVYVLSFAMLGVAADFRYAYWCVLATLAGAVAAVLARDGGGEVRTSETAAATATKAPSSTITSPPAATR
jgi:hypothetical protein